MERPVFGSAVAEETLADPSPRRVTAGCCRGLCVQLLTMNKLRTKGIANGSGGHRMRYHAFFLPLLLNKNHRKQCTDERQDRHQAPELDKTHLPPRWYC